MKDEPNTLSPIKVSCDVAGNLDNNDVSLEDPTAPGSSFRLHIALSLVPVSHISRFL